MAIKPIPSPPFPLCSPIASRRQAAAFPRRSSLLPPHSLADSSFSGEPLPPLLAQYTPPCHGASPDPELACARALQVLLCFSPTSPSRSIIFDEPFRRITDAPRPPVPCSSFAVTSCTSGEQPRFLVPLASLSSLAPPCSGDHSGEVDLV